MKYPYEITHEITHEFLQVTTVTYCAEPLGDDSPNPHVLSGLCEAFWQVVAYVVQIVANEGNDDFI